MRTPHRTRTLSAQAPRGLRPHRVLRPIAGQCFEITVRQQGTQWVIHIPEIDDTAEAPSRSAVELAARERIAASTGIPLGYISVWVRD
ncbi:MAG: long chain fatty acid-CoA synthetase Faa4p [Mycobacterium sp.]